jgi:tRNA pseudouridine55 synthase
MDGIILVDKPPLKTSHDVVLELRRILRFAKIGHFGTLDPLATGILIAACGQATRLFPYFSKHDKTYQGRIRLGFSTDTYDAQGQPTSPVAERLPSQEEVLGAMAGFSGNLQQVPPAFSAKKFKGKPLYRLARNAEAVPLNPSSVVISSFELKSYEPPDFDFSVRCSAGTYIRSLAHDLGLKLGCGGHLTKLVRTAVGPYTLDRCLALEQIRTLAGAGSPVAFLIPLEALLSDLPKLILTEKGERCAKNGNPVLPEHILSAETPPTSSLSQAGDETLFRLFGPAGKFIAIARRAPDKAALLPVLVFN